jgi:formylglycine-generating enzyme required for sulfatase activity
MKSEKDLSDLFNKARIEKVHSSFDDASNQLLDSIKSGTAIPKIKKSLFNLKNLIIMFSSISILTVLVAFLLPDSNTKNTKMQTVDESVQVTSKPEKIEKTNTLTLQNNKTIYLKFNKLKPFTSSQSIRNVMTGSLVKEPMGERETEALLLTQTNPNLGVLDAPYIFPKLTEKEISDNHKQKKDMLKSLLKYDKKIYAYVPSGSFEWNGKTVSAQAFHMQKTEVSNLEYRTFLFDLLIQRRKHDFLKAKPDQSQWKEAFPNGELKTMEEKYFSHEAFNNYPVVNVSQKGAEMYCIWLNQELLKIYGAKETKNHNDVRLPFEAEFYKAASVEGKNTIYAWGDKTTNDKGCYLGNYSPSKGNKSDDGGLFTVTVDSYIPNEYGIYNLSGNVAELVYAHPSKELKLAGGSWNSKEEEIKVNSIVEPGATVEHPTVGFRVVMTFMVN